MFGIRFIKSQPTVHLMQFRAGKVVREGAGQSFFYYAPTTTLVAVPVGSQDCHFMLELVTADFQSVTVQGQVTYRISTPRQTATLMDFSLARDGQKYLSEDPQRLGDRVTMQAEVIIQQAVQALELKQALRSSALIARTAQQELAAQPEIEALGLEILGVSVMAVKPTPDIARALEAEARESNLKAADDAVYARRMAAVENERAIRQNELDTDVAVERKSARSARPSWKPRPPRCARKTSCAPNRCPPTWRWRPAAATSSKARPPTAAPWPRPRPTAWAPSCRPWKRPTRASCNRWPPWACSRASSSPRPLAALQRRPSASASSTSRPSCCSRSWAPVQAMQLPWPIPNPQGAAVNANEHKTVLVVRRTRLDELVAKYHTLSQARFYIEHLGADFGDYLRESAAYAAALQAVVQALEARGRYQIVDRALVPNFVFGADDIVVALGQDGMVANTMKYLDGQPLIGVNPEPARWDGLLLPFAPADLAALLGDVAANRRPTRAVTLAEARLSDGQVLRAANDLFIGPRSHTSALYDIALGDRQESQSSSGLIVATGLGSSAWIKSIVTGSMGIARAVRGASTDFDYQPFAWDAPRLDFAVREPFPSRSSTAELVYGQVTAGQPLTLRSRMPDHGVIFSDGMEADYLQFTAGMQATIGLSDRQGCLVV